MSLLISWTVECSLQALYRNVFFCINHCQVYLKHQQTLSPAFYLLFVLFKRGNRKNPLNFPLDFLSTFFFVEGCEMFLLFSQAGRGTATSAYKGNNAIPRFQRRNNYAMSFSCTRVNQQNHFLCLSCHVSFDTAVIPSTDFRRKLPEDATRFSLQFVWFFR